MSQGNPPEPQRQEVSISTGMPGVVLSLAKIISGMTTDKALTLFVAGAFGWLLFSIMQQITAEKANTARMYEDSRERDRRHCTDREDKLMRDQQQETEKMRTWYASQSEVSRKFEAEQRDKDRLANFDQSEKHRSALMSLAAAIARKIDKDCPIDP